MATRHLNMMVASISNKIQIIEEIQEVADGKSREIEIREVQERIKLEGLGG